MSTDLLFMFTVSIFFLLMCCTNQWLYVCLISLVEVLWALVICLYARLAVEFFDITLYFWALGWLFVATVESIAGIFTFVVYSQLTGQVYI